MRSFMEWCLAEEAKVKAPDPDERKLKALEHEVAILRKKIGLRKARERERRDLEAVHKAQKALTIEDENWTLEGCLSPTFRKIQDLDLPQFIQASLAELAKRIRPAELLRP